MLFVFKVHGTKISCFISTTLSMPSRAVWGFCPQAVHAGSQVDSVNAVESHTLGAPQVLLMVDSDSHCALMKNLVQAVGMIAT